MDYGTASLLCVVTMLFLLFIGVPIVLGYLSRRYLTRAKGERWFHEVYRPFIGKVSMLALFVINILSCKPSADIGVYRVGNHNSRR